MLAIALVSVIALSLFAAVEWFNYEQRLTSEFFVGVECAYGDAKDCKDLVDKVRNFTNLFVLGSPDITFNQTVLNETCDYIYDAGLFFIVMFTAPVKYVYYYPYVWIIQAKQKYGDRFLGAYYYDEPGGNQLDNSQSRLVLEANNYTEAANSFVEGLYDHVVYYSYTGARVFTADYALYWFDYKAGYDIILAEFGWNHSRPLNTGLCRGAAKVRDRDWGVIVTWTYNGTPYIESGDELYDDLTLAYHNGAKYVVIFDYPKISRYGILTEEHFDAIRKFWNYVHVNPANHGNIEAEVAYVLPEGYGFGFRSPNDTIWGLWNADELSKKIWDDVDNLLKIYDSHVDFVYDDPELNNAIRSHYNKLIFLNETDV